MNRLLQVAVIAGIVGGVGWIGKMLIMAAQGGPDLQSVPESIAFVTGLAGVAVASVCAALYLTRSRPTAVRILAGVAAAVAVGLVIGAGQAGLTALPGDSWVQEEAIFGILGVLAVVAAVVSARGADARSR